MILKTFDLIETKKNCWFNYPVYRNKYFKLWINDLICHNLTYGLLNFLSLTHCEAVTSATSSKVRAVKFFHLTFFYTSLCSLSRLGWAVWLMGEITASTKSMKKKTLILGMIPFCITICFYCLFSNGVKSSFRYPISYKYRFV